MRRIKVWAFGFHWARYWFRYSDFLQYPALELGPSARGELETGLPSRMLPLPLADCLGSPLASLLCLWKDIEPCIQGGFVTGTQGALDSGQTPLENLLVDSKRRGAPETRHRQWEGGNNARTCPCTEERSKCSDGKGLQSTKHNEWGTKREKKPTPSCTVVQFQNGVDKREGNVKAFWEWEKKRKKNVSYKGRRDNGVSGECKNNNRMIYWERSMHQVGFAPGYWVCRSPIFSQPEFRTIWKIRKKRSKADGH